MGLEKIDPADVIRTAKVLSQGASVSPLPLRGMDRLSIEHHLRQQDPTSWEITKEKFSSKTYFDFTMLELGRIPGLQFTTHELVGLLSELDSEGAYQDMFARLGEANE